MQRLSRLTCETDLARDRIPDLLTGGLGADGAGLGADTCGAIVGALLGCCWGTLAGGVSGVGACSVTGADDGFLIGIFGIPIVYNPLL